MEARNEPVGKRQTAQRGAILRVLRAARGPLTIDELHERARGGRGRLGVATVYRTVKLLLEAGRIHALTMPDGQKRYEPADRGHHHHFRCRRCERVYDLPGCAMAIPDGTVLPAGFIVDNHEVTLFGTCPECAPPKNRRCPAPDKGRAPRSRPGTPRKNRGASVPSRK